MGTDYSRYELSKAEKKKLLAGLVGAMAIVGVIFRSSCGVHVQAGTKGS